MMLKFYQDSWFDIPFSDIDNLKCNINKLALKEFYDTFYSFLFSKYKSFDDLPLDWKREKDRVAEFIQNKATRNASVVSYGCGIGYIEKKIFERNDKDLDLHLYDFSSVASKWIKNYISSEKLFYNDNFLQEFDLIYMNQLIYAFDNKELIKLLQKLKKNLNLGGQILIITGKRYDNFSIYLKLKTIIKQILSKFSLFNLGQFWGYLRTNKEIYNLIRKANYTIIDEGYIEKKKHKGYYFTLMANDE